MIRAAKFADVPAIEGILRRTHQRSKYANRMAVCDKALNALVMAMVGGQNQSGPQATHVNVCEQGGQVVGFMASSLARVYNIGDKLVASDVFLINEGKSVADTMRMIDAYIAWARANPKVIEIELSWSDAVANASSIASSYKRKGMRLAGETYEMRADVQEMEAA